VLCFIGPFANWQFTFCLAIELGYLLMRMIRILMMMFLLQKLIHLLVIIIIYQYHSFF